MFFLLFFFLKNKFYRNPPSMVCCLLRLGNKSFSFNLHVSQVFIFYELFAFFAHFSNMILYYLNKKKHICKKPLVFVCFLLKLGSRASLLISRNLHFFYELFAFLAPYDYLINFRLASLVFILVLYKIRLAFIFVLLMIISYIYIV